MAAETIKEFTETEGTERLLYEARGNPYFGAMRIFDEYPTYEARRGILGIWKNLYQPIYLWQADWIEQRVFDLKKENRETSSDFWKELLNWYVFNAGPECTTRSLEFAISLVQQDKFREEFGLNFYRSDILKIIAGKIHRTPEVYSEVPALKLFLGSFLEKDCSDFTDVRRVIRCIIDVQDTNFLPQIEETLHKLAGKKRAPGNFRERAEDAENLAFLKEARHFLKGMRNLK